MISFFENEAERIEKNLGNDLFTKIIKEEVIESAIFRLFSRYGVISRYVVRRPKTTFKTQYAMIQYTSKDDMLAALHNAPADKEIKALYQNEVIMLNPWQDKETRRLTKEAKINADYHNQNPYMQINPQQILPLQQVYMGPKQMLGAPTVGNNQMNQIPPMNN